MTKYCSWNVNIVHISQNLCKIWTGALQRKTFQSDWELKIIVTGFDNVLMTYLYTKTNWDFTAKTSMCDIDCGLQPLMKMFKPWERYILFFYKERYVTCIHLQYPLVCDSSSYSWLPSWVGSILTIINQNYRYKIVSIQN